MWMCVCVWVECAPSAWGPEKPVLWVKEMKTLTLQLYYPECLLHCTTLTACQSSAIVPEGGIPLKWPCIEVLILSVAPANSGHMWI